MFKNNNPCQFCETRHYSCHSNCKKHIEWKHNRQLTNEMIKNKRIESKRENKPFLSKKIKNKSFSEV